MNTSAHPFEQMKFGYLSLYNIALEEIAPCVSFCIDLLLHLTIRNQVALQIAHKTLFTGSVSSNSLRSEI